MKADANRWPSKLSKEFVARLASIPGHETLHAVVLLETSERCSASQRHTPRQRRAAIGALRSACRPVLVDMDEILAKRGGRRLDDDVSALGTVAVEATPGVIKILANLKDVKTVLEDQNVSMLP
jgi:hypothetical protein